MDDEMMTALSKFKADHGRTWKHELRLLWMRGKDDGALRRVRNVVGPSRLDKIKVP